MFAASPILSVMADDITTRADIDSLLRTLRMAKIARAEEGDDVVRIAPL